MLDLGVPAAGFELRLMPHRRSAYRRQWLRLIVYTPRSVEFRVALDCPECDSQLPFDLE